MDVYAWLGSNKEAYHDFSLWMSSKEMQSPGWVEWFPIRERLLASGDRDQGLERQSSEVLLVDIGGGTGHDLKLFRRHLPDAKGKLILQDLEGVISRIDTDGDLEATVHDFFTPQPIKGMKSQSHMSYVLPIMNGANEQLRCKNLQPTQCAT